MTDAERELVTLTLNAVRAAALANRKFTQMTTLGAGAAFTATAPRRGRPPKFETITDGAGGGGTHRRRRRSSRRGTGAPAEIR